MECITFLTALLQVLKLSCPSTQILGTLSKLIWNTANAVVSLCYYKQTSSATESWIDGVYYISHCATSRDSNLSVYKDFNNQFQFDLKHSECSYVLVLLQANINSTWNLDRWYVLHFSLTYSRDKNCPSTQNLGWNLVSFLPRWFCFCLYGFLSYQLLMLAHPGIRRIFS